jgi:hypothetical protein
MHPHQLIEHQAALVRLLESNPKHGDYMWRQIVEELVKETGRTPAPGAMDGVTESFAQATLNAARAADVFRVTADMVTVLQYAASQLDEEDLFDPTLAPSGCGMVRFDEPLYLTDVDGDWCKIHWLLWGPGLGGTLLYIANDINDPDRMTLWSFEQRPEVVRQFGRWLPVMGFIVPAGKPLGPENVELTPEEVRKAMELGNEPKASNFTRIVHAFWLLCEQTIADKREEHIRKTARKQAEKLGIDPRVTVVQLRRSNGSRGEGESQVEWTRRWVVKGHWRWQAHGPGRAERKRIWIHPFIKGPEDAPLIASSKVYDLKR